MRIFKAVRHRGIRLLWLGQVFSGVGDEVYNIALVWYATSLIGTDAGYVASVQAASIFLFSLIGGMWVDHHDNRKIMIVSDLIRGFVVLVLPISTLIWPISLWLLVPVAIVIASVSALFGPALKAFLPSLIEERELLETTNGLMETTNRIARVIGPGLIAILSRIVPVIHYFTVNAVSFFISAWSISLVKKEDATPEPHHQRSGFWETLSAGYRLSKKDHLIYFILISGAFCSGAWLFIYPLAISLYLKEFISPDVGTLGMAIFGYGIGNISSNLILSNMSFSYPARLLFVGEVVGGVGSICLAFSQNLWQAMAACALTAVGGPMTDLGLVNLMQRYFRGRDLARIHRFNTALSYGCLLVMMLVSPKVFEVVSVPNVIIGAALMISAPGIIGLFRYRNV